MLGVVVVAVVDVGVVWAVEALAVVVGMLLSLLLLQLYWWCSLFWLWSLGGPSHEIAPMVALATTSLSTVVASYD